MVRPKVPSGDGPLFEKTMRRGGEALANELRPATPHKLGWMPLALIGSLVATGLWGAWVTRNVLAQADLPPMAKVQLAGVVGEYVQAQAHSASPPDQVTAETRAFMAEIQRNLEARGDRGQIVLVGEAVLAGDVPDITAELRREVYARVRMPHVAPATATAATATGAGARDVMGAMRAAMAAPQGMANVPTGKPLHAPGN